jgi:hypothetical protein
VVEALGGRAEAPGTIRAYFIQIGDFISDGSALRMKRYK